MNEPWPAAWMPRQKEPGGGRDAAPSRRAEPVGEGGRLGAKPRRPRRIERAGAAEGRARSRRRRGGTRAYRGGANDAGSRERSGHGCPLKTPARQDAEHRTRDQRSAPRPRSRHVSGGSASGVRARTGASERRAGLCPEASERWSGMAARRVPASIGARRRLELTSMCDRGLAAGQPSGGGCRRRRVALVGEGSLPGNASTASAILSIEDQEVWG